MSVALDIKPEILWRRKGFLSILFATVTLKMRGLLFILPMLCQLQACLLIARLFEESAAGPFVGILEYPETGVRGDGVLESINLGI